MLLQLRWMKCLAPLLLLRIAWVPGLLLGIPLARVALGWGALRWKPRLGRPALLWGALGWEAWLGRPALLRVTSLGRVAGVARVLRRLLLLTGVEARLGRRVLVTTVRVVSGRERGVGLVGLGHPGRLGGVGQRPRGSRVRVGRGSRARLRHGGRLGRSGRGVLGSYTVTTEGQQYTSGTGQMGLGVACRTC